MKTVDFENCSAVSSSILRELWTVYRSETTLQACRQVIVSRLLSGGIAYVDGQGGALVDEDFFEHVQRHFVNFARDVVDSLCVQGFVAFTLDAKGNCPNVVPPNIGQYFVRTDPRTYARSMVMVDSRTTEWNSRVLFFVENWPVDGLPVSAVASYRRIYGFKSMVELNTATADFHAARPIILTTMDTRHAFDPKWVYDSATSLPVDRIATDYTNLVPSAGIEINGREIVSGMKTHPKDDVYTDNTWAGFDPQRSQIRQRAEAAIEHSRILNQSSAASEYHEKLANDLNSGRLSAKDVRIDPYTGLPVFGAARGELKEEIRENVMQLPLDTRVLAQITPHSRPDLVPILEHATRQACICMGVPPSGLGVGGTHTALEAAASEGVLKSTLQRFRRAVTRCLLDVYVGLYGQKENLTVFFPSLLNTATAKSLFDGQILTYEAFCDHIRTIYSLPRSTIFSEREFYRRGAGTDDGKLSSKFASDTEMLRAEVPKQ